MWLGQLRSGQAPIPTQVRDVIHVATSFKDMTGRHVGNEISQTYADTGEPTGVAGQSRWTVIEKYESDGVTLNPKWVAMEDEFSWIALDPAMTSVLLHTNTYTGWKLNEDGTYSLSTMENKHIHAMDTSEVSLMGEMLGRVEINDGVTKYFGADGKETTLPQPTIGIALEFFPGTTYVDTLGLDGNPTIRTYTQVTDVGNGLPLGSVVGTAEIVTTTPLTQVVMLFIL